MKHLKVFNTKAEYQAYYANNRIPSSVLVYVKEDNIIAFSSNNVNGEFSKYSNEDGGSETETKVTFAFSDGTSQQVTTNGELTLAMMPENKDQIINVEFDSGVTIIGEYAFEQCSLFSVIIPDTIVEIKAQAFSTDEQLRLVTIGNGVTTIGECAFNSCTSLNSLTIGSSVTSIGEEAFNYCNALTEITYFGTIAEWEAIEKGNNYITDYVEVIHCSDGDIEISHTQPNNQIWYTTTDGNIIESLIPSSIEKLVSNTYIDDKGIMTFEEDLTYLYKIFYSSSTLESVIIPNSVTTIKEEAFNFCSSLTSVTIPNSVTSIGDFAFGNCTSLTSITIPNNLTEINSIFGGTSLSSIEIPYSVSKIEGSFYCVETLTSVTYDGSSEQWYNIEINSDAFYGIGTTEVNCTDGTYPIYQRSEVEDYEENITRFLNSTNQDYTEQQFDGGLETWALIDYNYSQYDTLNIGTGVTTIHSNLFQQEENLQYYIKYVTIPNSVSSIRNDAFSNIYLEKIRIGNGVTYIGENAFSGNGNLTDVYYNGTMEEWQNIILGSGVFDSTNVQLIHCTDGDYSL